MLSAFAFCLKSGLDFLADVLCIVFVDYISERKEIIIKLLIIKSKAQTGRKSAGVGYVREERKRCNHHKINEIPTVSGLAFKKI